MTICVNCGVELDDGLSLCPLCGNDPSTEGKHEKSDFNYPSEIIQLNRKEIRISLWELSAVIAFSAVAVCTLVDLVIIKGLGWSLISDVFVIGAWITFTLFILAYRKAFVIIPGLLITILAALLIIDLLDPADPWFLSVGLPLTIATSLACAIIIILYRIANLKGLNIMAVTLLVLAGLCVLTELILDEYLKGVVNLRWSLIASISIIPLSLLLLFYHYRLKKGNLLDRFLHV